MNISKYKIFEMISQNYKLSEIAAILNISQPTVSFHLKSLEKEFGIKLFDTLNKSIVLTKEGTELLPYISELLSLDSAIHEKATQYLKNNITIKIGSTLSPSLSLLPKAMNSYMAENPNIHFKINVDSAKIIMERLLNFQYDIGLLSTNEDLPSELHSELLFHDPLVFLYPKRYEAFFENELQINRISQLNYVHHSENSSTRKAAESILKHLNLTPKSCITVNSIEVIKELIHENCGISILPLSLVIGDIENRNLGYCPIPSNDAQKSVYLIYHEKQVLSGDIMKFINTLLDKRTP